MNKKKLKKIQHKEAHPCSDDYAFMNHTQIIDKTKSDESNKKQNDTRWAIKDLKTKKYFKSNIKTKSQRNHSSVYE
ncbi:MAG: hypothetical protein WD717_02355 [Nitrosarchaeum sp.]